MPSSWTPRLRPSNYRLITRNHSNVLPLYSNDTQQIILQNNYLLLHFLCLSPRIPVDLTFSKPLTFLHLVLRTLFQVPYPVSPAVATLTNCRGWGYSSHFGKFAGCGDENSHFIQALSFHILAHSFAPPKTQLVSFQSIPHSLPKTTRGGGMPLFPSQSLLLFWKAKNDR